MQFNLSNIVDDSQYKERFSPGIHNIEILSVAEKENRNGKKFLGMIITDDSETMEHEEQMYLTTEKAVNAMLIKIKEIYEAVYGKGKFPEGDISTEKINADLSGRKLRVKLNGEEYDYDGKTYVRPSFPYRNFAESLNVAMESSKLRFNEDRDVKKLPVEASAPTSPTLGKSTSVPTNLSFS